MVRDVSHSCAAAGCAGTAVPIIYVSIAVIINELRSSALERSIGSRETRLVKRGVYEMARGEPISGRRSPIRYVKRFAKFASEHPPIRLGLRWKMTISQSSRSRP